MRIKLHLAKRDAGNHPPTPYPSSSGSRKRSRSGAASLVDQQSPIIVGKKRKSMDSVGRISGFPTSSESTSLDTSSTASFRFERTLDWIRDQIDWTQVASEVTERMGPLILERAFLNAQRKTMSGSTSPSKELETEPWPEDLGEDSTCEDGKCEINGASSDNEDETNQTRPPGKEPAAAK